MYLEYQIPHTKPQSSVFMLFNKVLWGDVSDVGAKRIYYISKLKNLQNPAKHIYCYLCDLLHLIPSLNFSFLPSGPGRKYSGF